MSQLLLKEVRALSPYLLAAACIVVSELIEMATGLGIEEPLSQRIVGSAQVWSLLGGSICFYAAHGAIHREFQEGTVGFLDQLPVRRTTVFAAKVVALLLLVGAFTLAFAVGRWGFGHLGALPGDRSFGSLLLLQSVLVGTSFVLFTSFGLAVGWLGSLGWMLLLVILFSFGVAAEMAPAVARWSPLTFMEVRFEGPRPVAAWGIAGRWGAFSLGLVALSAGSFSGLFDRVVIRDSSASSSLSRIAVFLTMGLLLMAGLPPGLQVLPELARWMGQRAEVVHRPGARFLVPDATDPMALRVMNRFDEISRRVGSYFDDIPLPTLDVELTESGGMHAGRFLGGKLRLRLDDGVEGVLAHELAHAFSFQWSGYRGLRRQSGLQFFIEGSAEWVAQQVIDDPEGLARLQQRAGLLAGADRDRLLLLLDEEARRRRFSPEEVYPLGFVFVSALVKVHGPAKLPCIFEAMGRHSTTGLGLWSDLAASCRLDLDAVSLAYRQRMKEMARSAPKLNDVWEVASQWRNDDAWVSARAGVHRPSSRYRCRFRSPDDAGVESIQATSMGRGGCRVPSRLKDARWFQVQVGLSVDERADELMHYGEWLELPRVSAPGCREWHCARDALGPWGPIRSDPLELVSKTSTATTLGRVTAAASAPEGHWVAMADEDGRIERWEPRSGGILSRWSSLAGSPVHHLQVSADGRWLLAVHTGWIVLWDVSTGLPRWQRAVAGTAATLFPDRAGVVVSGYLGGLSVLAVASGAEVASIPFELEDGVDAIHVEEDGALAVARTDRDDGGLAFFDSELRRQRELHTPADWTFRAGRALASTRSGVLVDVDGSVLRFEGRGRGDLTPSGSTLVVPGRRQLRFVALDGTEPTTVDLRHGVRQAVALDEGRAWVIRHGDDPAAGMVERSGEQRWFDVAAPAAAVVPTTSTTALGIVLPASSGHPAAMLELEPASCGLHLGAEEEVVLAAPGGSDEFVRSDEDDVCRREGKHVMCRSRDDGRPTLSLAVEGRVVGWSKVRRAFVVVWAGVRFVSSTGESEPGPKVPGRRVTAAVVEPGGALMLGTTAGVVARFHADGVQLDAELLVAPSAVKHIQLKGANVVVTDRRGHVVVWDPRSNTVRCRLRPEDLRRAYPRDPARDASLPGMEVPD